MRQLYYIVQTLLRGRGSSLTKLLSLTLGLAVGVLLFSQIAYELNYERCYPDADRLVLVAGDMYNKAEGEAPHTGDYSKYDTDTYDVMAPTLAQDMAEWVESGTTVLAYENEQTVFVDNRRVDEATYIYVDTCFFRTLGIEVLKGKPEELIQSDAAFVSQSFARRVFGDADPVGRVLTLDKQSAFTVRGVYQDMPHNSMLKHDFVLSIHRNGGYFIGNGWKGNDIFYAILRLKRAEDFDAVNANLMRTIKQYTPCEYGGWKVDYEVITLPRLHTAHPDTRNRLLVLSLLGAVILFVASMNYALVTVASLSRRAKMVGVFKCNGASGGSIFRLFLTETGLFAIGAAALSALLFYVFRDVIRSLLGVSVADLFTWETCWVPLLTVVALVFVAGVIPARMLARIPVTQLFQRYTEGRRGWKNSLLAVQFTGVSFVLGLLMMVLAQYSLFTGRDMGIRVPGLMEAEVYMHPDTVETVCDYIKREPYVQGVTVGTSSVLGQYWTQPLLNNEGRSLGTLNFNYVLPNYTELMGIEIVEGRTTQQRFEVLVNEELVRLMRWTDGAIGKRLLNSPKWWGTIVGVFRDVRNEGFNHAQSPVALIAHPQAYHAFEVRLKEPYADNLRKLNAFVDEAFSDISMHFIPVQQKVRDMYQDVSRFRNAVGITSGFILLIVLIGLIGYVGDETQRRSKEIAIRKVNGAESRDIFVLLSRSILRVAVPTVLIGTALAWFSGRAWREQFVEQASVSGVWYILLALVLLVLIVAVVVMKAWRIANEDPVRSIKSE